MEEKTVEIYELTKKAMYVIPQNMDTIRCLRTSSDKFGTLLKTEAGERSDFFDIDAWGNTTLLKIHAVQNVVRLPQFTDDKFRKFVLDEFIKNNKWAKNLTIGEYSARLSASFAIHYNGIEPEIKNLIEGSLEERAYNTEVFKKELKNIVLRKYIKEESIVKLVKYKMHFAKERFFNKMAGLWNRIRKT